MKKFHQRHCHLLILISLMLMLAVLILIPQRPQSISEHFYSNVAAFKKFTREQIPLMQSSDSVDPDEEEEKMLPEEIEDEPEDEEDGSAQVQDELQYHLDPSEEAVKEDKSNEQQDEVKEEDKDDLKEDDINGDVKEDQDTDLKEEPTENDGNEKIETDSADSQDDRKEEELQNDDQSETGDENSKDEGTEHEDLTHETEENQLVNDGVAEQESAYEDTQVPETTEDHFIQNPIEEENESSTTAEGTDRSHSRDNENDEDTEMPLDENVEPQETPSDDENEGEASLDSDQEDDKIEDTTFVENEADKPSEEDEITSMNSERAGEESTTSTMNEAETPIKEDEVVAGHPYGISLVDKAAPNAKVTAVMQSSENAPLHCDHFLSCDSADPSLPTCNFEIPNYIEGSWVQVQPRFPLDVSDDEALDQFAYHYQPLCNKGPFRCHVAEPTSCPPKSHHLLQYHWMPKACQLEAFSANQLDRLWAGKHILFVGDSLMRQMYNSIRFLMRSHWMSSEEALRRDPESFRTRSGATVEFSWSKYLLDERSLPSTLQLPARSWPDRLGKVDWVIMNVGHHWHKKDPSFELYPKMAHMVMEAVQERFKGSLFVFRTSVPGYYGCEVEEEPVEEAQELSASVDLYEWRKPIAAEVMWKDLAQMYGLEDRFRVLNVSWSALRADGHVGYKKRNGEVKLDCLHWCMPGVPDYWNYVLFNLFVNAN